MQKSHALVSGVAAVLMGAACFAAETKYDLQGVYQVRDIRGWTVLVNPKLKANDPALYKDVLELLDHQFFQITREVPAAAVQKLRKIRLWVELDEPHHPCMAYHPDAFWLRDHDMNPDKARCVEMANARNFIAWTHDQPWMVLHEFAHGYHDQFLPQGYANAEIVAAYEHAKTAGLYDKVLRRGGAEERAYAITNPMEYFAESTEAFFGTNDFYPFVRPELRQHDPQMYDLLENMWGVPPRKERKAN